MKALILAGGYGTRLKPYINYPKALLEVGGKAILSHILENVCRVKEIESIILSTNEAFREQFESYLSVTSWHKPVHLVIEPSKSEGHKLGSIGGIQFVIHKLSLSEDLVVIGGDNLFEMDLSAFLRSVRSRPAIGVFDVGDEQLAKEYGVVTIDRDGLVKDFNEKPEHPNCTLVSTAIYHFPKHVLLRISEYLSNGGSKDRLGDFLSWLYKRESVYAYTFSSCWFDIGTVASLKAASGYFGDKNNSGPQEKMASGKLALKFQIK